MSIVISCKKSQVKIGVLLPHQQNDRNKKEKIYLTEKIRDLGAEALFASAEHDDKLQISQAIDMISRGAKVLIINPVNYVSTAEIVRLAHKENLKVIAYDRIIKYCDLDFFVSFNNEKVGQLMAQYVTNSHPQGKYMILGGDKLDQNAIWVNKGQMDVLNPFIQSGKIKIVYNSFIEAWSGDYAKKEIEKFIDLSSGDFPDVIISSSDGISSGVIEALKEYGLQGKVKVTGQDASLKACRNIIKNYQTMTVYKPYKKLAFKAAELAVKIANNESPNEQTVIMPNGFKNVPAILYKPVLVDKNNIKSTVVSDGFLSEQDIYQE